MISNNSKKSDDDAKCNLGVRGRVGEEEVVVAMRNNDYKRSDGQLTASRETAVIAAKNSPASVLC